LDDIFRFARFEADRQRYQLWRDSRPIKIERIPLELLFLLLENRGRLVHRAQIVAKLWGDSDFLDTERSINTAIRKIRKALEDDPHRPKFIETVVGQGYRFIASRVLGSEIHDLQQGIQSDLATLGDLLDTQDTAVLLRDFRVETGGGRTILTCDIAISNASLGRMPLLEFGLPCNLRLSLQPRDRLALNLHEVRVSLTDNAAQALHDFSVSVLQKGLRTRKTDSFRLSKQTVEEVCRHQATQAVIGQQP